MIDCYFALKALALAREGCEMGFWTEVPCFAEGPTARCPDPVRRRLASPAALALVSGVLLGAPLGGGPAAVESEAGARSRAGGRVITCRLVECGTPFVPGCRHSLLTLACTRPGEWHTSSHSSSAGAASCSSTVGCVSESRHSSESLVLGSVRVDGSGSKESGAKRIDSAGGAATELSITVVGVVEHSVAEVEVVEVPIVWGSEHIRLNGTIANGLNGGSPVTMLQASVAVAESHALTVEPYPLLQLANMSPTSDAHVFPGIVTAELESIGSVLRPIDETCG